MPEPPRPDPPAHSIHVQCRGIIGANNRWANTFWIRNGASTTPGAGDLQNYCSQVHSLYVVEFLPHVSSLVTLESTNMIYYGGGGLQIGADHAQNNVGGLTSTPLPANISCCISWGLQQRYKGGHPRTYLPPPQQDKFVAPNLWDTQYVADVLAAAGGFITGINSSSVGPMNNMHLGVVSFVLKNAWRNPPVFRDFTPGAQSVDRRVDSQRRRLGRDLPS